MENSPDDPVKSRFHNSWPGQEGSAGCSTNSISGRRLSHCGQRERRLLNRFKPHGHGLHAAQGETAVVGRCGVAQAGMRFTQALEYLWIARGNGAEQQIAVSAHVLGQRLHGHVNAVSKSVKINAGRPCVVEGDERAVTMRGFSDGGRVLHLHGDGAGALTPHQARVGAELSRNCRARAGRIVADLNAEAAQHAVGEHAIGAVNAFRQQHMVAALEQRQMDQ